MLDPASDVSDEDDKNANHCFSCGEECQEKCLVGCDECYQCYYYKCVGFFWWLNRNEEFVVTHAAFDFLDGFDFMN